MSTVLVIDDEPDIVLTVRLTLELAGHKVLAATNGADGLHSAEQMPDAIVLDIRLPDIDGTEVLQRLKRDARLKSIPVLTLSAHSSPGTTRRCLDLGSVGYVAKPFVNEELVAAVEHALAGGSR